MSDQHAGDGGGREYLRVAERLRVRVTEGTYPLRSFLPSQRDLAEEFGVSRDTVQRALQELKDEGWIESRQGSGSRVVRTQWIHSPISERPDRTVTLGPLVRRAFEVPHVTLDVYTLTSESLDAHIRLQTQRIGSGEISPQSITLRMLLPHKDVDFPYWRSEGGVYDQLLRERFLGIAHHHTTSLRTALSDLRTLKLVPEVHFELRRIMAAPLFKTYLFNKREALHGLYGVYERPIELGDGRETTTVDVFGLGANLTHHVKDDDPSSPGTVFVSGVQSWFDGLWDLLAV